LLGLQNQGLPYSSGVPALHSFVCILVIITCLCLYHFFKLLLSVSSHYSPMPHLLGHTNAYTKVGPSLLLITNLSYVSYLHLHLPLHYLLHLCQPASCPSNLPVSTCATSQIFAWGLGPSLNTHLVVLQPYSASREKVYMQVKHCKYYTQSYCKSALLSILFKANDNHFKCTVMDILNGNNDKVQHNNNPWLYIEQEGIIVVICTLCTQFM
jgi:hypothetical protein